MKTYKIRRGRDMVLVMVILSDDHGIPIHRYPLKHIIRHSPTGFEFGYGGSGPADLALSILCDHFGEINPKRYNVDIRNLKADPYYQLFKARHIATLDQDMPVHEITSIQISDFIAEMDAEKQKEKTK